MREGFGRIVTHRSRRRIMFSSRQNHTQRRVKAKAVRIASRIWVCSLVICTLAAGVSFEYIDVPIAHHVEGMFPWKRGLATGFASAVLLSIEATVALTLVAFRIMRGHLSRHREATALACLTSISAYAINDSILKHVFGVPNPAEVLDGTRHVLRFLSGSSESSFPSGHMVLAGAFAGVFMRLYRSSILPFSALLISAALLLILGDWHFVSDVIAGAFIGVSTGMLAGELWLVHSNTPSAIPGQDKAGEP